MADVAGANGERTDFKVVGKPNLPGKLSYNLASGKAKFGTDANVPDMLHAKFLRCPYAYAAIKSMDISAAKALPGVVDIVTWDDPELKQLASGGFGGPPTAFIDNIGDYDGAEVGAIVVAETEDLCEEALRLIKVDWEVRPHIVDPRDGIKPDAPKMLPRGGGGMFGGPAGPPSKNPNVTVAQKIDGDFEAALKQADQVIEFDFVLPAYASHIPNPSGGMAYWYEDQYSGEGKSIYIEGATQGAAQVAGLYKLPAEKVNQATLYQGGKYCDWGFRKSQLVTPFLSKRTGRPVKCVNTRADMYDFAINQWWVHATIGFKNDGLITAVKLYNIADNGSRGNSNFGSTNDMNYGPWATTRCLNVTQIMDAVSTNRGKMLLSGQHCPFGWDTMTVAEHMIAEKLGMDVMDVATRNLHGPDAPTDTAPVPSYEACVAAGKKLMNWQYHKTGAKKLPDGRLHGMAFRYQMCPRHAFSDYYATVQFRGGKVYMPTQGPCTGIYATDAVALVVAEEMGAKWEDVIIEYDNKAPFTPVGGGSDGTTAASWVMKEAAALCKKKVLEAALNAANGMGGPSMFGGPARPSPLKGAKLENLDAADSKIFLKSDPSKFVPFSAVQANCGAIYSGRPPAAIWGQMGKKLDTMNAQWVEVAVDTETGEVEVLRHIVACDPGKVIRRTSLESQIHQVMMFTDGCQLTEEIVWDRATGVRLTNNVFDYRKPTMLDIAPTEMEILETRAGNAAYGANGISHSMANTHIIVCAIQNAIGKWVDPPATPDKVLKALGKA
jgi:CO/xanthine dehydrogenase Mo-binding subunit